MRKSVLILLACLLTVPAVGAAALMRGAGDGTLSVEDGQGRVVLALEGAVIGRFDRGVVTIYDRTPRDGFDPRVWGAERIREVGRDGERYAGQNVRFRLIGGEFVIVVNGRGIDLSAVGTGTVTLEGTGREPGLFSLDGADCSVPRARCRELPALPRVFPLGDPEPERTTSRSLR